MADRKANYLVTLVFDENTDIRKQVDTEHEVKSYIKNGLQHAIVGREIKHFVIADDEVINKKLTEERKAGKWVELTNKTGTVIALRCNCCGKSPKHAIRSLYCPNCGAEMGGSEEWIKEKQEK